MTTARQPKRVSLEATIIRANGTREPQGVIYEGELPAGFTWEPPIQTKPRRRRWLRRTPKENRK